MKSREIIVGKIAIENHDFGESTIVSLQIYDSVEADEIMHVGTGFKGDGERGKKYSCVLYKKN